MEVCPTDNTNKTVVSEDISWALQIGDLDTVKEQLQILAAQDKVNVLLFNWFNVNQNYSNSNLTLSYKYIYLI